MCAAKGYELVLTLPQGMSREREALLRLYGARVEITESMGGMDEAVRCRAASWPRRDDVFLPDQFSNPANPEVHRPPRPGDLARRSTATSTSFVAGVGTGGTITGVGEVLKERNPEFRVVAVEPALRGPVGPHARSAPHPGHRRGLRAAGLDRELLDEIIAVSRRGRDRDRARAGAGGGHPGAAFRAGRRCGRRCRSPRGPRSRGKLIVTVLPDTGERYLSTPFFAPD